MSQPHFLEDRDLVLKLLARSRKELDSEKMFKAYKERLDATKPNILVEMMKLWTENSKEFAVEYGVDPDQVTAPIFMAAVNRYPNDPKVLEEFEFFKQYGAFPMADVLNVGDTRPDVGLISMETMAVLDGGALSRVFHDYKDRAEFLFVYIIEAHPTNGWSFGVNHFSFVKFPKSIEDRRDTARTMMSIDEDLFTTDINDVSKLRVVLDSMENSFNLSYSAQPDRVFIIVGDKIEYIGKTVLQQLVTPDRLFVDDIREWFDKNN